LGLDGYSGASVKWKVVPKRAVAAQPPATAR
jgi:hypothetical protein